jgi:hypothetical protein
MASRSKSPRRREPDTDSLEALKPLVVLGLLGMILYGAYSIVQKGPTTAPPSLPEAPPFQSAADPAAATETMAAAPLVELPAAPAAGNQLSPPAATALLPAVPAPPPSTAAENVSAIPPAAPSTPTYLSAQSAPPPESADAGMAAAVVAAAPLAAAGMAGGLAPPPATAAASAALASPSPAALEQAAPTTLQSAAFASAWADAHDKLAAGRYAEALAVLSAWHDDSSLGLEESQRLEELLGQLAGTVIYSQADLLLPPHVVAAGETLDGIAAAHAVPWQLLGKINGIDAPERLVPGEALKLVRGPFDAVVSVSRRRMTLQVGGNYAGTFPVVIGRGVHDRVGASVPVAEVRREGGSQPVNTASSGPGSLVQHVAGQIGTKAILLQEGLRIEAIDDPVAMSEAAPDGTLIVTPRDLDDLVDILGLGSRVLIRQ